LDAEIAEFTVARYRSQGRFRRLDWLAAELIENGWRLKHLHRLIVTSAAYRQSSSWSEPAARLDAGNRLLW